MASQKTKTAIVIGVSVALAILFFGGITFFILKARARAEQARELADLKENNPVEYFVLHTPARDVSELHNAMVGTWQLAGAKSGMTGDFVLLQTPNLYLKTFTLTNWAIATYDNDSNLLYSASGHYTLQGDLYTESIEAATGMMTKYLGAHPKFRVRLDGDKYYQMGAGKNPSIEEMWQRVE